MGLFSRSKRTGSDTSAEGRTTDAAPAAESDAPGAQPSVATDAASGEAGAGDAAAAAPVAQVGISVSAFRGVGAPAGAPAAPAPGVAVGTAGADVAAGPQASAPSAARRVRPPAEAPSAQENVPGLRDNALLRAALATLPDEPSSEQVLDVARQLLQGHVFLRVKGDARELLSAGKDLPLMVASQGDAQYVMAYSGGEALQASVRADGDVQTSAMGQPVTAVLRHVLSGPYAGLVLDHASAPARLVLPRDLLEKALGDASPELTVKSLLAAPRTAATATEVVAALTGAPLWIAANKAADGQVGIAEARSAEGERFLEVFSHPLEVFALGRKDQPVAITAAQLAAALASDEGLTGLLVDPAGPWIQLSRTDLAPVIALAA
jgi:hypothetical protein